MKKELQEIAEIRSGIYAKPSIWGDIVYLQGKHLNSSGKLKGLPLPELKSDTINAKHLLKQNDILVASKGTKNFATLFTFPDKVIASSTFLVVHINEEYKSIVLPEYLTWVINHHRSQQYIKNNVIGTGVLSLSKQALGKLVVPIPPVAKQQAILKISDLYTKEKRLKRDLDSLRNIEIQQQLITAIEK